MKQSISKINFICLLAMGFSLAQPAFAANDNFKLYSNNDFTLQLPKEIKGPLIKSYPVPTVDKPAIEYGWAGGISYQYANIIKIKKVPINNTEASKGFIDSTFLFAPKSIKSQMCQKIISDPGITNTKLGKYNAKYFSIICENGDNLVRINLYGILAHNNAYVIEIDNLSKKNGFNQEAYNQALQGVSTISLKK